MGGFGISYAGVNELNAAEQRRDVRVLLGHVGLVGPDAVVQPRQEIHIIGDPATELLRRVDVCIYQPWKNAQNNSQNKIKSAAPRSKLS